MADALRAAFPDLRVLDGADAASPVAPGIMPGGAVWYFIDWLLDDTSGLEMCRRLRAEPASVQAHITLILEEDDAELRRRAMRAGADDYMAAPLTPERLVARMRAYRSASHLPALPSHLVHGDLVVDLGTRQVRWRGRPVAVRPNELSLLAHFLAHPDRVFSRTALIGHLGKDCAAIDERTVDVWIGRLRRALKAHGMPDPLRTVRSLGYVLDSPEAQHWPQAC